MPFDRGAAYGDFRLADGSRLSSRGLVARNLGGGTGDAGVFGREYARAWRGRGGRRRTGDFVRTSASCSGARLEARRGGVASREAQ